MTDCCIIGGGIVGLSIARELAGRGRSVSAGLDYPGVGPEHSYWHDMGRVEYTSVTDMEALDAFDLVARNEGILPALETSHALAWAVREAATRRPDEMLVVCLSGRGDKDAAEIARLRGLAADGGKA